ncbi:protein ELYS-like [Hydractinia symbiolongicarpus]|uniref:protein ELYS-like n=1 Tax=Hydractinia symbiolongicarpus TaxID=13093 RepID=UPI00254DE280|nr:protein ELYS-like [Hydractinia symbiolongicarpus]
MRELTPYKTSEVIPFALSIQENLDKAQSELNFEDATIASIYENGRLAFIGRSNLFEIINVKSGQRKAAFDLNAKSKKQSITAFCTCGDYFIISVRCTATSTGQIHIYNPGVSRVIKVINLPYVPVSLALVKEFGGVSQIPTYFSPAIKCMFGTVAVGTENGHIFLIDLRLDDVVEQFSCSFESSLLVINPDETENMATVREKARNNDLYCCLDLSYSLCSPNAFKYLNVSGQIAKVCSSDNCSITSLKYLHQAYVLVVGFSFGCFQIWSLEHLHILYSSPVGVYSSPVTHFAFQEPDDDPRHCCFLWVGRGPQSSQAEISSATSLTLYQLLFELKEKQSDNTYVYKNIECVIRRFDHQLTSDVHHMVDSRSVGSRIISMKTLEQPRSNKNNSDVSNGHDEDKTICYVIWESPTTDIDTSMSCHLGIFDINRWYQKQLPSSIRDAMYGRMEAVCPFFAFYSLTDIAEAFLPSGIMDAHVNVNSLNEFRNIEGPQSEQFYWPSSSAFRIICISESGCIEAEMLGMQRQIMADMKAMSTDSFLDAHDLVQSCWVAGLLSNSTDITKPSGEKRNTDVVLSVSLEHNGTAFITDCIKKWSHGSITHAGHSLKLIFDWAWNQVVQYKKTLDQLHIPIFCSLSEQLEKGHESQLNKILLELQNLVDIFKELQHAKAITVEDGVNEINTRLRVASYLSMYSNVLLVLLQCGLLPEQPDHLNNNNMTDKITYPFKMLSDYYEGERQLYAESNESEPCLFIDSLWKEMCSSQEYTDGMDSQDVYPPPTVEVMCRLFVENLSEKEIQISVFYYWVLDICECCEELLQVKMREKVKECLKLNREKSLLIECVWLLDHNLYKDAAEHLSLVTTKISSLYYHQVIRILYHRGELSFLTLFCSSKEPSDHCTYEETKFLITVLLQMSMLPNAYKLLKSFPMQAKKTDLFNYFVEKCKEHKLLGKLLCLAFTVEEEEMLRRFLESSKENENFLLVYYLERGLYNEACQLTKSLKNATSFNMDQFSQEHSLAKSMLVDGFLQAMPTIRQSPSSSTSSIVFKKKDGRSPLSSYIRKFRSLDTSTRSRSSTDVVRQEVYDVENSLTSSKSFFAGTFTNQRRRKSPLFDGEIVSPTKKQKEMTPPRGVNKIISAISGKQRKNMFSGTDAFLLLKTPPVRRVSQLTSVSKDHTKTPQSILKSRIASRLAGSKSAVRPPRSPSYKPSIKGGSFTPGRKIRFVGVVSPTSPISGAVSPKYSDPGQVVSKHSFEKQHLDLSFVSDDSLVDDGVDPEPSGLKSSENNLTAEKEASLLEDFLDNEVDTSCANTSTVDDILNILDEESTGSGSQAVAKITSEQDEFSTKPEKLEFELPDDSVETRELLRFDSVEKAERDMVSEVTTSEANEIITSSIEVAHKHESVTQYQENSDEHLSYTSQEDVDMKESRGLQRVDDEEVSRDVNGASETVQIIDSSSEDEDSNFEASSHMHVDIKHFDTEHVDTEDVDTEHVDTEEVDTEHFYTEHVDTEHVDTEDVDTEDVDTEDVDTEDVDTEDVNTEDINTEGGINTEHVDTEHVDTDQVNILKHKQEVTGEEGFDDDILAVLEEENEYEEKESDNENFGRYNDDLAKVERQEEDFSNQPSYSVDDTNEVLTNQHSALGGNNKDSSDVEDNTSIPMTSSFLDDQNTVTSDCRDVSMDYVPSQSDPSLVIVEEPENSTVVDADETDADHENHVEKNDQYLTPVREGQTHLEETMNLTETGSSLVLSGSEVPLNRSISKRGRRRALPQRKVVTRSSAKKLASQEQHDEDVYTTLHTTLNDISAQDIDSTLYTTLNDTSMLDVDSTLHTTLNSTMNSTLDVKNKRKTRSKKKTVNSDAANSVVFLSDDSVVEVRRTTRSQNVNENSTKRRNASLLASPARNTRSSKKNENLNNATKSSSKHREVESELSPARNTRSKTVEAALVSHNVSDVNVMVSPLEGKRVHVEAKTLKGNLTKVNERDASIVFVSDDSVVGIRRSVRAKAGSESAKKGNANASPVLVASATKLKTSPNKSPKKTKEAGRRSARISYESSPNRAKELSSTIRTRSADKNVKNILNGAAEVSKMDLKNKRRSESRAKEATESVLSFVPVEEDHVRRQSKRSSSKRASLAVAEQLKHTPRRSIRARVTTADTKI